MFILSVAVNIRVPGNDRNLQAIFLPGLQKRNQLLYSLSTQGRAGDHHAFHCFPNVLFKDRAVVVGIKDCIGSLLFRGI